MAGFFEASLDPSQPDSYDSIQRKRKLAQAMMAEGMSGKPIQHWTQGLANVVKTAVGSYQNSKLDDEEKASSAAFSKLLLNALGGDASASPAASAMPAIAQAESGGSAPKMTMPNPVSADNLAPHQVALLNAIAAPESGGAYNVRYTPKGGATFQGFDAHPGVFEPGPAGPSSAAGRYQFTKTTWDRLGGGAFTPAVQDQRALQLAQMDYKARTGRDLDQDLQSKGLTPEIARALGPTWAGLKDNPSKALSAYQSTLGSLGGRGDFRSPGASNASQPSLPPGAEAFGQPQVPLSNMQQIPGSAGIMPQGFSGGAAPQPANVPTPPPRPVMPGEVRLGSPEEQAFTQLEGQPNPDLPAPGAVPAGGAPMPPQMGGADRGKALIAAALADPRLSPQQKQMALQMYALTQKEEVRPTWGKIGTDPEGREMMGWINPKTMQVTPGPNNNGGPPKAPVVQRVKQPDGSEVAVQWDEKTRKWAPLDAPGGGNPVAAPPKLTEAQAKDVNLYNRGSKIIDRLEKQDVELTKSWSSLGAQVPGVGNYLKSDSYRQAEQTGRELLAIILRKDTGAAVTDGEMQQYGEMYLPRPGDDPGTIKQKQEGRRAAIEGLKMGLGPGEIFFRQQDALEKTKAAAAAPPPPAEGAKRRKYNPATGAIE